MESEFEAPGSEAPASGPSPKLEAAERDVARAQARFSADLERASDAGQALTKTIVRGARPALIGVAVVTGVALIVAVVRSRRSRRSHGLFQVTAPVTSSRSLWWELGRFAVGALASSAGKHLAARLAQASARSLGEQGHFEQLERPRPPADS